jgi:hypothetical protein
MKLQVNLITGNIHSMLTRRPNRKASHKNEFAVGRNFKRMIEEQIKDVFYLLCYYAENVVLRDQKQNFTALLNQSFRISNLRYVYL